MNFHMPIYVNLKPFIFFLRRFSDKHSQTTFRFFFVQGSPSVFKHNLHFLANSVLEKTSARCASRNRVVLPLWLVTVDGFARGQLLFVVIFKPFM